MGKRKTTVLKQKYLRKKRLRETPRLPPELTEAFKEKGVDLSDVTSSKQFYSKLGLQSDPNADVRQSLGYNDKLREVRSKHSKSKKEESEQNKLSSIFQEVMDSLPDSEGYKRKLTDYEIKCIAQLRAYYGDDLEMMHLDHRRNPMQWTIAELRKNIELYEKEAAELEEQMREIEKAKNQVPESADN